MEDNKFNSPKQYRIGKKIYERGEFEKALIEFNKSHPEDANLKWIGGSERFREKINIKYLEEKLRGI